MLTAAQEASFERYLADNHIAYWFSDEARRSVLESNKKEAWSFDECMFKLNDLRKRVEASGDCELVVEFFAKLRGYERKSNDKRLPSPALAAALAEENAIRIYKLWFKHFDAWYTEFQANQENEENGYAF